MTIRQCDDVYEANKAAIRASGQTKRAFVAACRAGNATIPQGTAAAPPPQPAPAPASAPSTGSLFPWQQPAAPAPHRHLRITAQQPQQPAQASSLPTNKLELAARPTPSLGQHEVARLPFRWIEQLRQYET